MKKFAFASFALLGIMFIVVVAWVKINDLTGNRDGATYSQSGAQANSSGAMIPISGDFSPMFSKSFTFKNLQLIPVGASSMYISKAKSKAKYVPLKQAMEEGKVKVSEQGGDRSGTRRGNRNSGRRANGIAGILTNPTAGTENAIHDESGGGNSVNNLTIENTSTDTVYIMAGEVVKGGHQDRVIAQDILLKPNSGQINMGVFCVEPHRWSPMAGGGSLFSSTYFMTSNSVRREATVSKNQSRVWEEVGNVTEANNAGTSSGTYTALENSSSFTSSREDYLEAFRNFLSGLDNSLGVIAVSGDKVIACDLFVNPELFRKQFQTLLHSYIADAISSGEKISITHSQVEAYFKQFASEGKIDESKVLENGLIGKDDNGEWIHIARY